MTKLRGRSLPAAMISCHPLDDKVLEPTREYRFSRKPGRRQIYSNRCGAVSRLFAAWWLLNQCCLFPASGFLLPKLVFEKFVELFPGGVGKSTSPCECCNFSTGKSVVPPCPVNFPFCPTPALTFCPSVRTNQCVMWPARCGAGHILCLRNPENRPLA